jgi:guanine nucleotide-binding protein G(i) subunit alpha
MGCLDGAEKKYSKNMDKDLKGQYRQDLKVRKLLLLGAGGSGKSTIFKQMLTIYGDGFSDEYRSGFTGIVQQNVIVWMQTLCENTPNFGAVSSENVEHRDRILGKQTEELEGKDAESIEALWKDAGILATYAQRARFQLGDSASFFFDRIRVISAKGYVPSDQDCLRSRAPTTGIVENLFTVDTHEFAMFDVGGQRSERRKWIHCFDDVTAVLFIAALSAYDQMLFEDESTNRMKEALDLFDEVANSEHFENTAMILFLNKCDLFKEKIKTVSLKEYFPDYTGENDYEQACQYIEELFTTKSLAENEVYTHITCATDTANVSRVFNAVSDIVIKEGLRHAGLS